jgi:hypothetical protein
MTVIAPPEPSHGELEALIEEARERARRRQRRTAKAAALAGVLGAGVLTVVVLALASGGSSGAPQGFHPVQARGPLAHARIEWHPSGVLQASVVDIATGRLRSVPVVFDVWWDRKSGLDRVVTSIDGRVQSDSAGRATPPPRPFGLQHGARISGEPTFRGQQVVWVRGPDHAPVALDARTHEPLGSRVAVHGDVLDEQTFTFLRDKPAKGFAFVVLNEGRAPAPSPTRHPQPAASRRRPCRRHAMRWERACSGLGPASRVTPYGRSTSATRASLRQTALSSGMRSS